MLTDASQTATALSEAATRDAEAGLTRAARIGLAVGIAVILLLLGSAVFASLTIAKPIQKIGEVLIELAGGNKTVMIPYVSRGDEVGDTARAAQTFRDKLLRVEELEIEQQRIRESVGEERKMAMRLLADEFEAAIGSIVGAVSSASGRLEAAAGTLTTTAETTRNLSDRVANASEEGLRQRSVGGVGDRGTFRFGLTRSAGRSRKAAASPATR